MMTHDNYRQLFDLAVEMRDELNRLLDVLGEEDFDTVFNLVAAFDERKGRLLP